MIVHIFIENYAKNYVFKKVIVFALCLYNRETNKLFISRGLNWLKNNINDDG